MNELVKYLKNYKDYLSTQQIKTLKSKALKGDLIAARKGLVTILKRHGVPITLGRW